MSTLEQLSEALRNSLLANQELKRINNYLSESSHEPIAILSMSCRLPGGISTPEQLWRLVYIGGDVVGPLPTDRGWRLDDILTRHGIAANKEMWQGGFVEDAMQFDARFFGISDREALAMDPQQRLLLECTWEVIERAGIVPKSLRKTATGVFVGTFHQAYVPPIDQKATNLDGYRLQGDSTSMASGRIAYTFGFNGPAISVDTACSSSLVAIHLAVQSLRAGECALAVAGGASIIASPEVYVEFSRQNGLAADGRCKAFSEHADGTAFSEGVGMLLLSKLSYAMQSKLPILAVIRGSAINHDGPSNGLTAPSGPAQEQVIRQALINAGLSTSDIDIVEAHGTGTSLGDPIEANALIKTYGQGRAKESQICLGSLKSNIGHVQAAAGVSGIIKMVMALKHGLMPRTLYAEPASSRIEWSAGDVVLLTQARPWPAGSRVRRAAVSSFGFSGTNAHIVIEEPPPCNEQASEPRCELQGLGMAQLAVLSAVTPVALKAQARQISALVAAAPEADIPGICAALMMRRSHFDHRAACVFSRKDELVSALDALAQGNSAEGLSQDIRIGARNCAFVFSGQGAQWAGMGRQLYARIPIFARHLDAVLISIDPHLSIPLKPVLFSDAGSAEAMLVDRTDFTQPALFAIEVALYRTFEQLGVIPNFLCGHSIGEIAAAHVAGIFTLDDAAQFVARRGALMQEITTPGAMLSIEAREADVLETILRYGDRVSIAAINGYNSIVISGDKHAIYEIDEFWKARSVRTSQLRVSHAFHSIHMQSVADALRTSLAGIVLNPPTIPLISTVTGRPIGDEQACSIDYWSSQARVAVRYADAIGYLLANNVSTLVEMGPDAVLATLAQSCIAATMQNSPRDVRTVAAMRRNRDEVRVFTGALASLYVRGQDFDWEQIASDTKRYELPTYPFDRQSYWFMAQPLSPSGERRKGASHPFLEPGIELAEQQGYLFVGAIPSSTQPWLLDHAIEGVAINAGVVTADLLLSAGVEIGLTRLDNMVLLERMPLPDTADVDIQLRISEANGDGERSAQLFFRDRSVASNSDHEGVSGTWRRHASAQLARCDDAVQTWDDLQDWPPQNAQSIDYEALYDRLSQRGVLLGPAFRMITRAWRKGDAVYVEAHLPPTVSSVSPQFRLHPCLLDAALQAADLHADSDDNIRLLFAIDGMKIYRHNIRSIRACATAKPGMRTNAEHNTYCVRIVDQDGLAVAEIDSVVLRAVDRTVAIQPPVYVLKWRTISNFDDRSVPSICWIGRRKSIEAKSYGSADNSHVYANVTQALNAISEHSFDAIALVCDGIRPRSPDDIHAALVMIVDSVKAWLSHPSSQAHRLLIVTENAVAATDTEEMLNLSQAPIWGLIRSAQIEYPDRLVLLDVDDNPISGVALGAVLSAVEAGEAQLAIRNGDILVPRLSTLTIPPPIAEHSPEKDGVILVTGAGSLAALAARRLADRGVTKHIVFASRRGGDAPAMAALINELKGRGIDATAIKCDVTDRSALSRLIGTVCEIGPLMAVVHTAGISRPMAFADLTHDEVVAIAKPKIDAAWYLHELTKNMDISSFILFSSAVGIVGVPEQSHYGAANTFLDALAAYRRSCGLPASSLAWGIWAHSTEMGQQLGEDRLAEAIRGGLQPIALEYGLHQFELVFTSKTAATPALLIPAKFALSRMAAGVHASLLSDLVGKTPTSTPANDLLARYAGLDPNQQQAVLLKIVTDLVCKVLRNPDPSSIGPDVAFRSIGFDSLTSIELAGELSAITALRLPVTAVFDYETPQALVNYLSVQLAAKSHTNGDFSPGADRLIYPVAERAGQLLQCAIAEGRSLQALATLEAMAEHQPHFSRPVAADVKCRIVQLSCASAKPLLICLNSFIPSVGDFTYKRLAEALDAAYTLAAISLPGYDEAEFLPDDVDALSDVMANAVRSYAAGRPFALIGFSTGGLAAHAAAECLERGAVRPAAVIMIDTFHPTRVSKRITEEALAEWAKMAGNVMADDDAGAIALAWYLRLFRADWMPATLKTPLCLIQAEEGLAQSDPQSWSAAWEPLASCTTTPGRHFTLLRQDVAQTAAHVAALAKRFGLVGDLAGVM